MKKKTQVLERLPDGYPDPPIGRYGRGKLDLLARVNGVLWACLLNNAAFCTQEFYYWDEWRMTWIDRSLAPDERCPDMKGTRKHPLRRVPYMTLTRLAGMESS